MATNPLGVAAADSPVRSIPGDETEKLEDGIALCLSGGGYRAMLFHVGALLRLNELGVLKKLKRVSSVSGGSITAAWLGLRWKDLKWADGKATNLQDIFVSGIRQMASKTIDAPSVSIGILSPFSTIGERIAAGYDKVLFKGATLQNLPNDKAPEGDPDYGPRFVINSTNVQTGSLWRFSRPFMGDHQVGLINKPDCLLAHAVAASSAFPPVLSPFTLDVSPQQFDRSTLGPLFKEPYNDTVVLSDGGVYDNMGIETAWKRYKTVLVSDGGAPFCPEEEPESDWARHSYRILNLVDNQVRSLRRRQIMDAFTSETEPHDGTYWRISTDIRKFGLDDVLTMSLSDQQLAEKCSALAGYPTRLARVPESQQNRLMNWGYALCDAALRRHIPTHLAAGFSAAQYPFEGAI